jgi:hypothetical protein
MSALNRTQAKTCVFSEGDEVIEVWKKKLNFDDFRVGIMAAKSRARLK